MKKFLPVFLISLALTISLSCFLSSKVSLQAAPATPSPSPTPAQQLELDTQATLSASLAAQQADSTATHSATTSTLVDPTVRQNIQEKKEQDITETTGRKTDSLTVYVEENTSPHFQWHKAVQYVIRQAIAHGLPTNLVVLTIMFPLIAALIAFSRHVIGVRGFGIYAPAVLSVAFVSTGIPLGIIIFVMVILLAILFKNIFKKIALPHLPKTALLLWGITIGVLALFVCSALLGLEIFLQISIFPLLIIILLSENFMDTQLFSSSKEALRLTVETILIAIVCALIISSETLQKLVIVNPGLTLMLVALADVMMGKFTGLRWLEYFRFQDLLQDKK